eukprot:11178935-Lingulodinium_polyedra.AAC.1
MTPLGIATHCWTCIATTHAAAAWAPTEFDSTTSSARCGPTQRASGEQWYRWNSTSRRPTSRTQPGATMKPASMWPS